MSDLESCIEDFLKHSSTCKVYIQTIRTSSKEYTQNWSTKSNLGDAHINPKCSQISSIYRNNFLPKKQYNKNTPIPGCFFSSAWMLSLEFVKHVAQLM